MDRLPTWLPVWNELAIHDSLWSLWLSRRLPLGPNLPILSAGLDGLANSWHRSTRTKSGGLFIPTEQYRALIAEGRESIAKQMAEHSEKDRVLRKIDTANEMGGFAKLLAFFSDLGLAISDNEKDALRARHSPAHGGRNDNDDVRVLLTQARVYETLYHRVLLKALGYDGHYIDYGVESWPRRHIDQPSGGDVK